MTTNEKDYPHYFKKLPDNTTHVDVYHVLRLFDVTDGAIAHAIKKLLCAGKRGTKGRETDLSESIKSIQRCLDLDELERMDGMGTSAGHKGYTGEDRIDIKLAPYYKFDFKDEAPYSAATRINEYMRNGSVFRKQLSVHVMDHDHAKIIMGLVDTAVVDLVTFHWFNPSLGQRGNWCQLRKGDSEF